MASAMSDLFHRQLCGREFGPSDFRSGSGPPKRGRFRRCDVGSANHCSASGFDLLITADIARPISSADDS